MIESQETQMAYTGAQLGIQARSMSLTEQMEERKKRLERELMEVNQVLEGLKKNPEAADLLNAISRLGGLRY